MTIENRIKAFDKLGCFLYEFEFSNTENSNKLKEAIKNMKHYNGWFDEINIKKSISSIREMLKTKGLCEWIERYDIQSIKNKNIAVLMAGNIPLVGFHDLLCVLICGHNSLVKMSSKDNKLLKIILDELINIEPRFNNKIIFSNEKLSGFDAVIATGNNNSAKYFNYYFSNYPSIIRKNRNSIAILNGSENSKELNGLSNDIFQYYGLGCRNISKIFVKKDYNFDMLFKSFYEFRNIIDNKKYANNYDYNKAIYLMGKNDILDNGFLILKKDKSIKSPVSVLHYEYYDNENDINDFIIKYDKQIQCIVSKKHVPFGRSQKPSLLDYADNIDTMKFLHFN